MGRLKLENAMEWKWEWKKINVVRLSRQRSAMQIMVDQNEPNSVEYFNYLSNMVAMEKAAFTKIILFVSTLDPNLRKELVSVTFGV
jgi:hypothetical protein